MESVIDVLSVLPNTNKSDLGQFYTTRYKYILQNLKIPTNVTTIIEPFCGSGELLKFCNESGQTQTSPGVECYDIDPSHASNTVKTRDTLQNPPDYTGKFIVTNPPYLTRNKSKNKVLFDKYDTNDLYKCFLKEIITTSGSPTGGIIIIPLNFWTTIRVADVKLRKSFLEKYKILQLNIFEENVFDDTSYTVCSFQFELKKEKDRLKPNNIKITVYPSKIKIRTILNDENNFLPGGDIYSLAGSDNYTVTRLTSKNKVNQNTNISNILVKCIDDNLANQICLSHVSDDKIYIDRTPNLSSRTYATLIIEPKISTEIQKQLVIDFNNLLNKHRKKYNSLFLTNFRESKDIARKRISFDLVYTIVKHLLHG